MRNFILILTFLLTINVCKSQTTETLIASDYIETFDWSGAWFFNNPTTGYFTNISVTPTSSAVIYGTGNNGREEDWYSLPAVTVDPFKEHVFRMRLAAQTISDPTASTAGLDGGDYITVQLSKNGAGFVSELRVRGFSNATWDYSSTAVASKVSDGGLTVFTPAAGGDRTNLGDGYSYIELTIPPGPTSIAIDVYCRATRGGEDWWMDNFELYEINQNPLPVELSSFEAEPVDDLNYINWITQSEQNSDYFNLESSFDGENWKLINTQVAAFNSISTIEYGYHDNSFEELTYYRLIQYDIDGQNETFGPIVVLRDNRKKPIYKKVNLSGQEVDQNYKGIVIIIYQDGSTEKVYN